MDDAVNGIRGFFQSKAEIPFGQKLASYRTLLGMTQEQLTNSLCFGTRSLIVKAEKADAIKELPLDLQFRLSVFLKFALDSEKDSDGFSYILGKELQNQLLENIQNEMDNRMNTSSKEARCV